VSVVYLFIFVYELLFCIDTISPRKKIKFWNCFFSFTRCHYHQRRAWHTRSIYQLKNVKSMTDCTESHGQLSMVSHTALWTRDLLLDLVHIAQICLYNLISFKLNGTAARIYWLTEVRFNGRLDTKWLTELRFNVWLDTKWVIMELLLSQWNTNH